MDTNLLLSLLNKSGKSDITSLLSMLNSGKANQSNEQLFSLFAEQMLKKGESKQAPSISILGFVNDDILGKITRYMANRKLQLNSKK